jgi:hypothetical protein
MDDSTRRKIERAEAELERLRSHFPNLANPIAVGWLALRVERWRWETRTPEPHKDPTGGPGAWEG